MSGHGGCVVVTGAASGIGRAISMELASQGFVTALWDINKVSIAGMTPLGMRQVIINMPMLRKVYSSWVQSLV